VFIGAIKKWVDLQNSGDNLIVMLADLHTVTIPREPDVLRLKDEE
jgi:tryptophanyl-tRNA synthetase